MQRILSWRALVAMLAALALMAAACGSDDDDAADDADTAEESDTGADAEESDDAATDEGGDGIAVTLNDDFELLLGGDVAAGSVTFDVSNEGPDFPHTLSIVRAASIDDLPRNDANGAVDLDAVDPADVILNNTSPLDGGTAESFTVDLEAGDYVFFCPVQNESQSHVGAGQIVAVTVGG